MTDKTPDNGYKIDYTHEDTGQNFEMSHGLFYSNFKDGFLVPDFGSVIIEKR